ncbi:MAG: OmpH family outer membrane protein [Candidatus Eisenbacteria bacterium]|nr:OmpH family outer membrane protein [Candidatus Eisenbacteria bacterium]
MRRIWVRRAFETALIIFGLAVCPHLSAGQEIKIGFIRSATILDQYEGARAVTQTFNQDVTAWNQEAQQRRKDLDLLGKELESQSPMLTDQVRRDKEADYQRKLAEYDQYVQGIWGPGGLVAQRNEELLRGLVDKIQRVARKIADEEEYDFVFDASGGNIIYADRAHDLTQKVIEGLNQPE